MANNSSLSKRAALRQQQEQEERGKRNKRIAFAGIGLAAVVVVVVLAIVVIQAVTAGRGVTADQATPPNATSSYGILMDGKQPSEDKPHLVIWQDFQCPACAARETTYGPITEQLVAEDKITVEVRSVYFLDGQKIDGSRVEDGDSKRAAIAAAAADEVGKFREYHDTVFRNQPTEGVGYTKEQLRDQFAQEAGIEGDDLTKFQKLYDERAYDQFVRDTQGRFDDDKITGTPTYLVSGQQLQFADESNNVLIQPTVDDMLRAITEAWEAGGKQIDS
ncbi:Protein-disulfide isomerase [Tessaracoccus bendigoensis DSM 12906]|uniref:Protein-disulfide isomerase n=1 Tax=Tessaracoccus bendigoensis DSM 12906 TaxID=1123357 RepID=A0A1M6BZW1_9ACTN|nr:thioredoxin domain-containing protein [Tessaracoccus bendigoensis]SHI53968.1 Protein-disulfide isomerase [Tessaracoccus bendigoensis DSM 12906]